MLREEGFMIMNPKERKLEDMLSKYGFTRSKARCMAFMLVMDEGTSRKIEHEMDLRQPEVSIGMKELVKGGFVKISIMRTERTGKGRPTYMYKLAKSKETIIANMKKKLNDDTEKKLKNLAELKKMLRD